MKADLLYVKDIEKVQVQDMKSEVCLLLTDWMSKLCFGVGFCLFFFCFFNTGECKTTRASKGVLWRWWRVWRDVDEAEVTMIVLPRQGWGERGLMMAYSFSQGAERYSTDLCSLLTATGPMGMTWNCVKGVSGCELGRSSSLRRWSGIRAGSPGQW